MASPSPPPFAEAFHRGTDPYDHARAEIIWNKRLERRRSPDAIIRCTDAAEVAKAIQLAQREQVPVALRGSGHSYIAAPLRDEGLLLDLGALNFVEINPSTHTARVGSGARGGDLIHAVAEHGLGFPIGHCSTVALGGYLLSGGIGWNCGAWGPACRYVRAVELVLADGRTVIATDTEHPDLLWAARGSGCGFFAAVTAYHLDLLPLPPTAQLWSQSFAIASAPVLADWLSAATAAADSKAEIMCLVGPDLHSGEPSVTIRAVCTGDTPEEAAAGIASFSGPPADATAAGPAEERDLPFVELTKLSAMPDGKRVAADQCWSEAPMGDLLLAVADLAAIPAPSSTINLVAPGGKGRLPHMVGLAGALSVGGTTSCGIYAMWDDPADDARHEAWVRAADDALAPFRTSRYVGEADVQQPGNLEDCFTGDALTRIEQLRAKWDPAGRFHDWPNA